MKVVERGMMSVISVSGRESVRFSAALGCPANREERFSMSRGGTETSSFALPDDGLCCWVAAPHWFGFMGSARLVFVAAHGESPDEERPRRPGGHGGWVLRGRIIVWQELRRRYIWESWVLDEVDDDALEHFHAANAQRRRCTRFKGVMMFFMIFSSQNSG